jgi:hypothetical protein
MANLLAETYEGANSGYDNAGWTADVGAAPGAVDPDYTGVVLEGTQSFRVITPVGGIARTYISFTAGNERWAYFKFRPITATGEMKIFSFWDSGFAEVVVVKLMADNVVNIGANGTPASTTGTMTAGNTYHVWVHYNNTAHTADVGFSTDGVRPTSGANFAQLTDSVNTTDASRAVVGGSASDFSEEAIYDALLVADTQIGDQTPPSTALPFITSLGVSF